MADYVVRSLHLSGKLLLSAAGLVAVIGPVVFDSAEWDIHD